MKGNKNMQIKIKKAITVVLAGVAVLSAIALYNLHKDSQMDAYARENNCTWHYDYYINKPPICK